jgi:hypothetical protein
MMAGLVAPTEAMASALADVVAERQRQEAKWGRQNHRNGTGFPGSENDAKFWRANCDQRHRNGTGTWLDILLEEVYEAAAEDDPQKLRAELIQVAAVAVSWAEAIDRRQQ